MQRDKILFLGGDPGTCEMIEYAKGKGVYTIVCDWYDLEHSKAKRMADEHWDISYAEIDLIEKKCRENHVTAVMAASSEFATGIMIELCERLSLPCFADKGAFFYEKDKDEFKKMCRKHNVKTPDSIVIEDVADIDWEKIKYPVVVKPIDQCGGKGMTYCTTRQEVVDACEKVRNNSNSSKILIERKIEGTVYAAYYVFAEGEGKLLFLHSEIKSDPSIPRACQSGSTIAKCKDLYMKQMNDGIIDTLTDCGCKDYVAWVEAILDDNGDFYAIEMAHRCGADLQPVEFSYFGKINLMEWGVDYALGNRHSKQELAVIDDGEDNGFAYSAMVVCEKSGTIGQITGIDQLEQIERINILLNVCVGDKVEAGGKEIGYIGYWTTDIDELYQLINEIQHSLKIVNRSGENMIKNYVTVDVFRKIERI